MKKNKPSYITLYEKLRHEIITGTYPYLTRLPGKRPIADHSGFSLVTVEHALELLEEEGYIESKERSGFYVTYYNVQEPSNEEEVLPIHADTLPSSYDDEVFPSSVISHAIRRVLNEHPDEILKKTERKGLPSLRNALVKYLSRSRNIHVEREQIVIGSGAEYMYSLIVQMLGRNRIYGTEDPSYEKIARIYRANGAIVDPLKMGTRGILSRELERTPATVLHITPFHSYPSGVTADAAKRQEYINWAENRNGFLIEDDYDSEFTVSSKPEETLFSLSLQQSVLYLNTFSRTISPGIRVSYMIIPKEMLSLYNEKVGFSACTVSTLVQMVIAELIDSGEFERHINRIRRKRRKEMQNQSTGYTQ